jgi:hypothetical protein
MRSWLEALLNVIAMAAIQVPAPGVGMRGRISMRVLTRNVIVVVLLSSIAACSSSHPQPQPILERSDRTLSFGDPAVEQDLRNCRAEVREAAPIVSIQPRWLPPLGVTPNGIVLGAVDIPHPIWPSREAYRLAIERCLTARGYEIHGWQ